MKSTFELQKEEEKNFLEEQAKKKNLKESEERQTKLEAMKYDFVHVASSMSKEGPVHLFKRELPIGTTYIKKHGPYWNVYCLKIDKNKKIKINGKNYDSEYHKDLNTAMKAFHGQVRAHIKEVEYAVECMWNTLRDTEV